MECRGSSDSMRREHENSHLSQGRVVPLLFIPFSRPFPTRLHIHGLLTPYPNPWKRQPTFSWPRFTKLLRLTHQSNSLPSCRLDFSIYVKDNQEGAGGEVSPSPFFFSKGKFSSVQGALAPQLTIWLHLNIFSLKTLSETWLDPTEDKAKAIKSSSTNQQHLKM